MLFRYDVRAHRWFVYGLIARVESAFGTTFVRMDGRYTRVLKPGLHGLWKDNSGDNYLLCCPD